MRRRRPITVPIVSVVLPFVLCGISSCDQAALLGLTSATSDFAANLGIPIPRAMQVGFINNTPFRAIFTFGSYVPLDKETIPTAFGQLRLEGNTASAQQAIPCRKTVSVGGSELIRLLNENENDPRINIADPRALVRGVNFSGAPLGDPLEAEPTEGTADGLELRAGIDFTCDRTDIRDTTGSVLVLFTFEQDASAPGGFRIDHSVILP